jgi:uroporphyrinogen-III synthase
MRWASGLQPNFSTRVPVLCSELFQPQPPPDSPARELLRVPQASRLLDHESSMAELTQPPLQGRTIVVTRSRDQASALSSQLRALGAHVIEIPTIAIVPPHSYEPLDTALRELGTYDWLIVTSANTARVLDERTRSLGLQLSAQPRTIVVGPATAAAMEQAGFRVDLMPQPAIAESIAVALEPQAAGKRVLIARAEVARDLLPAALIAAGARVTIVDAYRTVVAEGADQLLAAVFGTASGRKVDALTFTSSSTVKNLWALLGQAGLDWPATARVLSIGPVTSGTLREHGIEPSLEATRHDVEGLVAVVLQSLAQSSRHLA